MKKNALTLALIGMVCLFTIGNIYSIYMKYSKRVDYLPGTTLIILGVLYYLSRNNILVALIILQSIDMFLYEGFVYFFKAVFYIVCYCALIACLFKIINNSLFDFLHLGILITSCLPLIIRILSPFIQIIIGNSNNLISNIFCYLAKPLFTYINCGIIIICSIILKVMHIDDSALFYTIMAVISIIGKIMSIKSSIFGKLLI